ncbi:MAG: MBL fold metallo-hydrolase [Candidatus Thorarchaeota archaeon]|jgi:7,8-dihydropterin-6-yl-methyl-4-(beta-D-ribofuranosyl)aminobenzene 5'-phosphate synthase
MQGLRILDRLEVIAVVDNTIAAWTDPNRDDVQSVYKWVNEDDADRDRSMVAGGGLCLLIRAKEGDETRTILYDAAETEFSLGNNIAALGLDLSEVQEIVMSHGHWDHFGGLLWALKRIGKTGIPVYTHPRMFLKTGWLVKKPEGEKIREMRPIPTEGDIEQSGGKLVKTKEPILLANNMLLRTGEVPRKTAYEKGLRPHMVFMDGKWESEPLVLDDVSLVAKVKDRGTVIISGCSHAGIINIIHHHSRNPTVDGGGSSSWNNRRSASCARCF